MPIDVEEVGHRSENLVLVVVLVTQTIEHVALGVVLCFIDDEIDAVGDFIRRLNFERVSASDVDHEAPSSR